MKVLNLRLIWALLTSQILIFSSIFSSLVYAEQQLSFPSNDLLAPAVFHEAIKSTLQEGSSLQIQAKVTDNVGIKSVTLYYRVEGSADYKSRNMQRIGDSHDYAVTLGQDELLSPGIEYYIQATDQAGNTLLHGFSFSPLKVTVESVSGTVPKTGTDDGSETTQVNSEPEDTMQPQVQAQDQTQIQTQKKKSKTWLWVGLGALAVGVIAAAASGGSDGGGDTNEDPGTVVVSSPVPVR